MLDGRGSGSTPPWVIWSSAKEAAPRLLTQDWPGNVEREGSQSCQQGRGPGLHAPGLPANNYSGD